MHYCHHLVEVRVEQKLSGMPGIKRKWTAGRRKMDIQRSTTCSLAALQQVDVQVAQFCDALPVG